MRVGEAKNPGPPGCMRVSGLNVQSLNCFLDDKRILSGQSDLLICSETCATSFVEQKATKILHAAGRHVAFGKAVDKRVFKDGRDCNTKGQAKGVAICSACPIRKCHQAWSDEAWSTSRVSDCYILTQNGQVRIFAVYGYHQGFPDFQLKNETLLREVLARASTVDIPCLIVGDLNCDLQSLQIWPDMQQAGWKDAAMVQAVWDQDQPAYTFKESRLDYILFNAKAASAFRSFNVSEVPETDHKSVNAVFDWTALATSRRSLKMPMDISKLQQELPTPLLLQADLPCASQARLERSLQQPGTHQAWQQFCRTYEDTVDQALFCNTGHRLLQKFRGRGQPRFVAKDVCHIPTRAARHGEFHASGDESTVLLRQRIRQIRRIQTYVGQRRRLEQMHLSVVDRIRLQDACCATWRSVYSANGFTPNFRSWWLQEVRDDFPLYLPSASEAHDMAEVLKALEPQWRQVCRRHRDANLTSVFAEDWKQGGSLFYRAIKPPGRPRVDSLDIPSHHRIMLARSQRKGPAICRMLDDDLQCVVIGAIWKQGSSVAKVTKICNGLIYLRQIQGIFSSGDVQQNVPTAHRDPILHEAKQYWSMFWNKPKDKGPGNEVFMEALATMPQLPAVQTDFSASELQWALSSLSTKKARGPDGFSNYELKYMPLQLRPFLLQLLNKFTRDHEWPQDLCLARMALLQKSDELGDISSTRPITILASVLRLWGKMTTRRMLRHIQAHLPATLFGSVPGRSTTDMIGIVQTHLEEALIDGKQLYGISLDFSKAYNTLPRKMLEQINQRLGFAKHWKAYDSYLSKLQRFFTADGHWGEPVSSQVGVPEGCPVAVVQMILITWLCTTYLQHKAQVDLFSYVDDWIMLFRDLNQAPQAIDCIKKLADSCGLILSLPKSKVFATTTQAARAVQGRLQTEGFHLDQAKNLAGLGINFQTHSQPTPQLRNDRWLKARVLLDRLQYMPWNAQRKTEVINRGIFPLVFYGCNTWKAGKDYLREVRAKCNHAVWGKKQYHLHYLSPIFSGTNYEPTLHVAKTRFSALLRFYTHHPQLAMDVWDKSLNAGCFFKNRTKGTISIFQNQLRDLNWELHPGGRCVTGQGWQFIIWKITTHQFQQCILESWEYYLLQHLRTKSNLDDLNDFSMLYSQYPKHDDPLIQGFMTKVRLGGLFPCKRTNHMYDDQEFCPFCGQEDSMYHRVYTCVGTEHIRQSSLWKEVEHFPVSLLLGGLSGPPSELQSFRQQLDSLPHPEIYQLPQTQEPRTFFTDGSAFGCDDIQALLCSWAVTEATYMTKDNVVRCSGLLPGRKQTVFRSELHAINVAIALSDSATIYADNESAVKRAQQIIAGNLADTTLAQHPDRDLLQTTISLIRQKQPGAIKVFWIKAHRCMSEASGDFDVWSIYHNQRADAAAKTAGRDIPLPILQSQKLLLSQIKQLLDARCQAASVLRQVMDEFP